MNTYEVFHAWAHQTRPSAKSGNVRFDGPTLYSYAQPIGYLLPDNRVLLSDRKWSVTTLTHQSAARGAVSHMARISAPVLPGAYGQSLEHAHSENLIRWKEERQRFLNELALHPRRKRSLIDKVIGSLAHQNTYRDFFELDWEEATFTGTVEECREAAEFYAESQRENEKRRKEQDKLDRLAEVEALAEWRAGAAIRRLFKATVLRLIGDEIETSQGARIPVEHAKAVWPLLKRLKDTGKTYHRNGHTIHLGHYPVDSFDGEELKVGCHTIPWGEIENMSKALRL